jgi:hypothetical protein
LGSQERTKEPPRRNPAMSIYRFRALKVSPGRKHHGIVTKTQIPVTGATSGERDWSGERGTTPDPRRTLFCNQIGQQIKLNGARLPR